MPAATTPAGVRVLATAMGKCGSVYGRQMQARLAQLEPVGLHGDRLVTAQQGHDCGQRFIHARPLSDWFDAEHVGVGGQGAGAAAQHGAPAGHVVELYEALGHQQRMVIGQAGHARAQHDVPCALGGSRDHQFRRGNQLPAGRVVLADPGLVIAEVIEPLDQLHVAGEGQGGIFADSMEGRQEDSKLESTMGHDLFRRPPSTVYGPPRESTSDMC